MYAYITRARVCSLCVRASYACARLNGAMSTVAPYSNHHVIPLPRSASVSPSFVLFFSSFTLGRARVYRVSRAKELRRVSRTQRVSTIRSLVEICYRYRYEIREIQSTTPK